VKRAVKIGLVFGHDTVAAAAAWCGAFWLRFNLDIPPQYLDDLFYSLVWVVPLQAAIFWHFGLFRGIWRFASLPDLQRIVIAAVCATIAIPVVHIFLRQDVILSRSILLIDPMLLVLMIGGSRIGFRIWKDRLRHLSNHPVLVLGTGGAAVSLLKELATSRTWRVVGLLDDDPSKKGRMILGKPVLGSLMELKKFSQRFGVAQAIIAMPGVDHAIRRNAVQACRNAGVEALTVPSFDDLINGRVRFSEIRHVELDDLLGRDPVSLDVVGLQQRFRGQVLMVTGAGGSIGSEICRQLARYAPQRLVFFELNEYALYQLEQEFRQKFPDIEIVPLIGDVKHRSRVEAALQRFKPAIVFHAAAYKHVPLMEADNAVEAVRNNVLGTAILATACQITAVQQFVQISTDKAVNPVNVMGASKRLAEMVCRGLQVIGPTSFKIVRFGNVLGSNGSVVPKFQEQIRTGGPVTVTHPDMTRFFMSIPEAVQLVLPTTLIGNGGEVFVLDMGEPVKVVELARELIRLSGFSEDDIPIIYSGLRPGEKMTEELFNQEEKLLKTRFERLRIAQTEVVDRVWVNQLLDWVGNLDDQDDPGLIKHQLFEWLQSDTHTAIRAIA